MRVVSESNLRFHDAFKAILHLRTAVLFVLLGVSLIQRNIGDCQREVMLSEFVFVGVIMLSICGVNPYLTVGMDRINCVAHA